MLTLKSIFQAVWRAVKLHRYLAITGLVVVALATGGGFYYYQAGDDSAAPAERVVKVAVLNGDLSQVVIKTNGRVESEREADLSPQIAGVVSSVYAQVGDAVAAGALLIQLASPDQTAAVSTARANLRAAELAVEKARHTSLNASLEAYPVIDGTLAENSNAALTKPTISGNYLSNEQGEYYLKFYPSHTASGYSFRFSGLETGSGSALVGVAEPFGTRGLFIQFPANFPYSSYPEWVVPVPNTRSSSFASASGLDLNLEAALANQAAAESALESALAALAKTQIRAPFSGEVVALQVKAGEYVTPGVTLVSLINSRQSKQVNVSLGATDATRVKVGDQALVDGQTAGQVTKVASGLNQQTGQVEAIVVITEAAPDLLIGEFVPVEITTTAKVVTTESDKIVVPLAAVKSKTSGQVVYVISHNQAKERLVTTGEIIGDNIQILSGLAGDELVAATARGLSDGVKVEVLR